MAEPQESGEPVELLSDDDRPGGWLLLIDRIRQSYVDLDDPTYLDFEYIQGFADVINTLPDGPLNVTHIGGGGCTFARYIAYTRPGSSQVVLEPDERVTALVRARLPFDRGARIRVRPVGGRDGVEALRDDSADVLVLDAFNGGRVPAELTTAEFFASAARVLRADGVLLINAADGGTPTSKGVARGGGNNLSYARRLLAAVRTALPAALLRTDPSVLRGRRFGNVVIAASRAELPVADIERAAAMAMFPQRVLAGAELTRFIGTAAPLTDAAPLRSPSPPDELWRVS